MSTMTVDLADLRRQTGLAGEALRPGTEADAVMGVVPTLVAYPQTAEQVGSLMQYANGRGLKVVPCGTRTKLDRGARPIACDLLLDLSRMAGVVDYPSQDLTVTVQAGMRLGDLQRVLAVEGQFLALDPPVPGTVGGLIATADSGPRRLRYGGVRDLLLGMTYVRADGVICKAGGRVVKNVAGYDLCKLFSGALGTLGVVVQATFRLYPLPATSATVIARGLSPREAGRAASTIRHSTLVPTSIDYFSDGEGPVLAVRFESSQRSVDAQAERAAEMLAVGTNGSTPAVLRGPDETEMWARFDSVVETGPTDVLAKLTSVPGSLPSLLEEALQLAPPLGARLQVRAHLGHGHALLRWQGAVTEEALALLGRARNDAEARDSQLVLWRAPLAVRERFDIWGDMGEELGLMRRIKVEFDPNGTLNHGRFVGGI